MNTDKTEFMSFKQEGFTVTLTGKHLKLVNQFTYLKSNISSTESDVNIRQEKVWTAFDKLLIKWKSDLSDKIKRDFSELWLCKNYCLDALPEL